MTRRARLTAAAIAAASVLTLTLCGSPESMSPTSSTTPPSAPETTTATPTTPPPTTPAPTTTPPPRAYPVTATELGASWRPGCPVAPEQLARVEIDYVGFDGQTRRGELIVNRDLVDAVVATFAELARQRFPIERMQNVTAYPDADDELSMRDNNTSAFNCRGIPGSTSWSWHAYGRAIDINPRLNPFISRGEPAQPANSGEYVDRASRVPGMLNAGDDAVRVFTGRGWGWGGAWTNPVDYQHVELPIP